jgi:hypothetical protein
LLLLLLLVLVGINKYYNNLYYYFTDDILSTYITGCLPNIINFYLLLLEHWYILISYVIDYNKVVLSNYLNILFIYY